MFLHIIKNSSKNRKGVKKGGKDDERRQASTSGIYA